MFYIFVYIYGSVVCILRPYVHFLYTSVVERITGLDLEGDFIGAKIREFVFYPRIPLPVCLQGTLILHTPVLSGSIHAVAFLFTDENVCNH